MSNEPWWHAHLPLAATVTVFAVFVVKVLAVSHGSTTTALGLLRASSPAEVAFGISVTTLVPFAVTAVAGYAAAAVFIRRGTSAATQREWFAMVVVFVASVFLLPKPTTGGIEILILVTAWLSRRRPKDASKRPEAGKWSWTLNGLVVFAVFSVLLSPAMWLPAERLTFDKGDPVTAYVIADGDRGTTVLRDHDRKIVWMPPDSLRTRQVCAVASAQATQTTLASTLFRTLTGAHYARCR